jgi:hypothetical protein
MPRGKRNFAQDEPATEPAFSLPLDVFIARAEGKHIERGVVAVEITHPEVTEDRVYPGVYSGIRLSQGQPSVKYSDGSEE